MSAERGAACTCGTDPFGNHDPNCAADRAAASVPLYEVVWKMKQAGMTEDEIAEVLARTPAEDEYAVIREVLDRRAKT